MLNVWVGSSLSQLCGLVPLPTTVIKVQQEQPAPLMQVFLTSGSLQQLPGKELCGMVPPGNAFKLCGMLVPPEHNYLSLAAAFFFFSM